MTDSLFPQLPETVKGDGWPADHEALFWARYPRRVAKKAAMAALAKARKRKASWEAIAAGLDLLVARWEGAPPERRQFIPHAATWLNGDRWEDQPDPPPAPRRPSLFEIAAGRDRA